MSGISTEIGDRSLCKSDAEDLVPDLGGSGMLDKHVIILQNAVV